MYKQQAKSSHIELCRWIMHGAVARIQTTGMPPRPVRPRAKADGGRNGDKEWDGKEVVRPPRQGVRVRITNPNIVRGLRAPFCTKLRIGVAQKV